MSLEKNNQMKYIILLLLMSGMAFGQSVPEIRYNGNTYIPVGDTYTNQLVGFTEHVTYSLTNTDLTVRNILRTENLDVYYTNGSNQVIRLTQVRPRTFLFPGYGTYRVSASRTVDGIGHSEWDITITDPCQ